MCGTRKSIRVHLRKLKIKDASLMLEWMHDPETQGLFNKNMIEMKLADAEAFCINASLSELVDGDSMHFAIVGDDDEYLGTVSLKNIDFNAKSAEYAISVRRNVQGSGVAKKATYLILQKGFKGMGLHRIYLNVLATNLRAIRFYEKIGFVFEGEARDSIFKEGRFMNLKWYSMIDKEFMDMGGYCNRQIIEICQASVSILRETA